MKRHRGLIVALLVVAVAAVVFHFGRRPADAPPPTGPVGPPAVEFTPAGWERFRAEHVAQGTPRSPVQEFLDRAASAGVPLKGYSALGPEDRRMGFVTLANDLALQEESTTYNKIAALQALAPLIDRHAADHPEDPWVAYFRARNLARLKKYAEAEPLYAEAGPVVYEDCNLGPWARVKRAECLAELGRWEDAFDLIRDSGNGLHRVADILLDRRNLPGLQGLIDRWRTVAPTQPELDYYLGELHWRMRNYPAATEHLADYLKGGPSGLGPRYFTAADKRFRALVRLDRLAEARDALAKIPTAAGTVRRRCEAILAAHAEDAAAVIRLMDDDRSLRAEYADEDLGPLLRTAAMAPVRAKYPPPAR